MPKSAKSAEHLPGYIVHSMRYWHREHGGDYSKFKEHYKNKHWVNIVTPEIFERYRPEGQPPSTQPTQSHDTYHVVYVVNMAHLGQYGTKAVEAVVKAVNKKRADKPLETVELKGEPPMLEIREKM